jgi:hypothetical protein
MRSLATLLLIPICFTTAARAAEKRGYEIRQEVPTTNDVNSAYYKYNLRVHKMLEDKVAPAFGTQTHRVEVDYEFNLDFQGHVTSLKTHAKAGGQWAEQTIARGIRALNFPAVPAQVFIDLKEEPPLRIYGTMTWDPPSADTNDLARSSDAVAKIKQVCHQVIGLPFRDAALWRGLQPFAENGPDFYQPTTTCGGEYCSGGVRLRDAYLVLYTYLHVDRDSGDLSPDVGRRGNNRIVGVSLVRHSKTIFSEGHVDRNTVDLSLRHGGDSKKKPK